MIPSPALECVDLRKAYGEIEAVAGLSLVVQRGEIVALLGPSGCGKTTALRLIAGFETADAGTVRIGGNEVVGAHTMTPPERRRVGMVFQDYALFPHLTVAANVRYGVSAGDPHDAHRGEQEDSHEGRRHRSGWRRWAGGRARLGRRGGTRHRDAQDERVAAALHLVALESKADRYPHELSGGEAQRIALARALAPRPELILLDEPFSNLDARLRQSVRAEVRQILKRAGASAVFVTHDQEEAFSLADRVAVMRDGRVEQIGTPAEIYRHPTSRFVAEFVGDAEFLPGTREADAVRTELGLLPIDGGSASDGLAGGDQPRSEELDVMVRPEFVRVESTPGDTAPGDTAPGDAAPGDPAPSDAAAATVVGREYYGHDQVIVARLASGRLVRARLGPADEFQPGDSVRLRLDGPAIVFTRS